ncbi:hypothetical protein [Sphingomonas sp. Leaf4]|uniref:hypothetical protein n=1 Tax=Sphingomonas sp. Leaf4 TaxID=2876553 RepID=UPI001E54C773|nr:hypothetical protein [Sphingomonas sp. Leaf4]
MTATLFAMALLAGCQPTDEQKLQSWLLHSLPERFANCIAERTYDALTPVEEKAFRDAVLAGFRASPDRYTADRPRTLAEAQAAIARDLPANVAQRVRATTARCHVHNWRLG